MSNKAIETLKKGAQKIIGQKNAEISLLKTQLKKANGEKIVSFKMPDEVDIKNFPEIQKVQIQNHPEVIKANILNLKDINVKFPDVQKVQIVSDQKEIIQKITIDNTEKISSWVPKMVLSVMGGISNLWARGMTVKLDDEERLKPLPVIIVDTKGRPIGGVQSPSPLVIPTTMGSRPGPIDGFNIGIYDNIILAYTGSNLTTVTYYLRSRVIAVLTLTYDGSNNLTGAQRTT